MDYIIPIPWEHLTKVHIALCIGYVFLVTYLHMHRWVSSFVLLILTIIGITGVPYALGVFLTHGIPISVVEHLVITHEWYLIASGLSIGLYMTIYICMYSMAAMSAQQQQGDE